MTLAACLPILLYDIGCCCRADAVVVTTTQQLAEEVMSITGGAGAYAAIDSIGGDIASDLAAAVRPGGTIYLYGLMGGLDFKGSGVALLFRDVRYHGFWLVPWLAGMSGAERERVKAATLDLMSKGIMKPETGGLGGQAEGGKGEVMQVALKRHSVICLAAFASLHKGMCEQL
jgi:NADPH:quinone reductase-like Zn-dependent oxidoreductase